MRLFRSDRWAYAILLIILLTIGALAVWQVVSYTMDQIHPDQYQTITIMIFGITAGFMLIAGAFGLWAIDFMAQAETKRRVGLIVDAMDFLTDGLIVLDSNGNIVGSNSAARQLLKITSVTSKHFKELVPSLSEDDFKLLTKSREPYEITHELVSDGVIRTLRFRSQPSSNLTLVVISDVTVLEARRSHSRQMARLQLTAQVARGVAHDFNSILTTISGHTTAILKNPELSSDIKSVINTIASSAEKGIVLARHLTEFARQHYGTPSTDNLAQHIIIASDIIKTTISPPWQIEYEISPDLPSVGINGLQIEQALFNLGLLITDYASEPNVIKIFAGRPSKNTIFDIPEKFACAVVISTTKDPAYIMQGQMVSQVLEGECGVILPIIRSIIEDNGGKLESIKLPDGSLTFRIALPHTHKIEQVEVDFELSDNIAEYLSGWSILAIISSSRYPILEKMLNSLKLHVTYIDNLVSAIAKIETKPDYRVIIVDKELTGAELSATLRVILKLAPHTGLLLFTDSTNIQLDTILKENVVLLPYDTTIYKLIESLVEAHRLATNRKTKSPSEIVA